MGVKIGSTAGFLWLDSWVMANIIYLGTQRFCERFLNERNDPKGRLYDQMVMSARSAPANIAEGASRHQTSTETEMKLTDVARATISELSCDYMNWILRNNATCWSQNTTEWKTIHSIRLDAANYGPDLMHDVSIHIHRQYARFAPWIENENHLVAANTMLIICGRLNKILRSQIESQLEIFKSNGGFTENLTKERIIAMQQKSSEEGAPDCPICGKPMFRRCQQKGTFAGREFWGCSDYPRCRGIRNI